MSAREFCIPVKTDSPDFKKLVEEIEKINERYSDDIGPICGLFAALKTKTDLTFTPKLFGVPAESKNLRQGEELIFVWGERSYVDSIYHKFKGFEVGSGLDDLLNGFVDEEHQFKNGSAQNEHFFYSEISDNKMVVPFSVQSLQQDISMDENQDKVVINELKSFDKQVDDVLRGADTTSSHLEVLKVTPPLLRMVGVPNLPILMTAKHVKTITQESGSDSANYHGLGIDLIKKLPELISDPVMIMDSISPYEKARKSIVVVTQTVDKENRPIIGAIKIAGFGNDSNGFEISANILTSAYGKDSFKTFIERNISQGAVLYADKAKSQALFKTPGLQLPDNFNSLDFDIIIRKTNAFVNRDEQKSSEKSKRSPLLINLFAGPSAGKTTAALELTAALKKKGFNVEYVSEYAKELVLENKTELLKNQVHVTDEQFHRLDRLRNSGVEIIVTDSPVLLGKVYGEGKISREYGEKLLTYHNSFDNFNLFVNRGSTFQTEGRVHNLEQSKELDAKILAMLQDNRIFYGNYNHDEIDKTVERITTTFSRLNKLEETTEKNEGSMTADTNNANAQSARERVLKVRDDMVKTLLAHIEKNPTDWQSGWNNIAAGAPYNGKTSTAYRGLNALYLAFLGAERGYKDTRWVTFNQAKELGASVKKGEKSAPVIFFEFYDRKTKKAFDNRTVKDMTEEEKTAYLKENVYAVMKYSSVFNAEQCHNFPERKEIAMSEEEMANQNAKIETIIANSSAPVRYDGGSRAYYSPGTDSIHLPAIAAFDTMQDYYATALHEIAHSTGHESRLNRDLNAEIRRVKERIEELSKRQEGGFVGWEFNGGEVRANTADNRLQIFFEEKPDEETRSDLKHNGFKWSPKANAWQRQLTENAYYAADRINAIQPLSGEKPTALQRAYVRQHNAEVAGNAVQSNAGEQRVGDHEEKITLKQARNAMLDAQEQRQNHYAVRIEDVPYTDPEDGYEGTEPAQVIYIISEHGNVREWKTIPLDSDVFSSDLPNGSLVSYEPIEYEELEEIAEKVKEPIQTYKDVLRAELEVDTERHRSEAYYDQRVDDILNEHYRTEYGLFERNIENPKYLSGMLYAEENFRGERVVSLTQNESGKNIAIIAQANGRYAVAEDYHTDDGRNWGKYHLFDNQESAEEFRTKNFPSIAERANRYQALAASKSPLGQEYARIKGENADSVVFYRVGDFYEVLGTDAERVAEKLELTLTGRTIGTEERVPMCGVPYHAIDQYADTLVKKGENVIIADGTDIREHKAKINITEKRLRDYADTLRRNDLEVGNTAQTDEYYLSQAREQIAAYERSDEYRQALREDFPTDFIDDTPPNMPQTTQNKPIEGQERKREWLSIELPNGAVGGQYGENTMIKMPKGEFSYYAFYVPTRFLKEADGKTQLRVASDYTFRLNNDGRQVELTGQELKDSFAGKHLDKTYKRVAPSRKFAQGLANIEKNVPAELKAIPTWCCYRTQWNEEKGKKDKFIISPIDGKWTSTKEPGKWVTFEAAMKYARENNCEGLSILLDKKYGITCIDLDKCIEVETGKLNERASKLVETLSGTYIERSTSGNGLHIFVKDDILKNGTYNMTSVDKNKGDLEVYDDKRIMSLTGDMYSNGNNLTRAGSAATVYLRQELGERRSVANNGAKPRPTGSLNLSDNELIRWIQSSKQGSKFNDLYNGRGVSGNRSDDDAKLAHMLLYFNGGDKDQAFRIMRESGAYRPDKPDSYYRATIDKMDAKIEVYAKRPTFSADGPGKPKGKGPGNGKKGSQA